MGETGLTESDIYWVNTSKLFKPFVYRPIANIVVKVGEKFDLTMPKDYFKDIDDRQLILSLNENELDRQKLEYQEGILDHKKMRLSGLPTMKGEFDLTFTATDKFLNMTEDKVKLIVSK